MGIVNVTPDSFSDGGRYLRVADAVAQGLRLADEGAVVLDIGGESTRPGAEPVDVAAELARVVPVLEGLRAGAPPRGRGGRGGPGWCRCSRAGAPPGGVGGVVRPTPATPRSPRPRSGPVRR